MAFDTMTQLGQMQKVPLDMTLDGLAALRQTQQADNIGLQELMRKQAHAQQMDPLLVAEQGLRNKGLILDQAKGDYELRKLGRNDKMETELWDQTKASKLAKMLDEQGEAEANVFGQNLYKRLQTTRPGTPEYKAIVGALQTTKGWMEKQREHQYKLGEIGAQGANAEKLMQMQIDAGRFKSKGGVGGAISIEAQLSKFKKAHEQHQVLVQAELMARQEGNEALADSYKARAEAIRPQAEQELAMMPKPGTVDVGRMNNGSIPTVPQGSIAPKNSKPGSSPDNPIVLR